MTWFAFNNGHPDINAAGAEEKVLVSYGFHGYTTQQEADAHKNSVNVLQEISLNSWDAAHAARVGGGAIGGSPHDIATVGKNVLDFTNWFIRGGEILLGIVLIGVGLAKVTGASNVVSKALKVVPK